MKCLKCNAKITKFHMPIVSWAYKDGWFYGRKVSTSKNIWRYNPCANCNPGEGDNPADPELVYVHKDEAILRSS